MVQAFLINYRKKRPGRKVVNEQLKSSVLLLRLVALSHSRDEDKTVEVFFFSVICHRGVPHAIQEPEEVI